MKYNKLKRYFLMLIVFSMLTSCFCFKAAAAEIDIYEAEPNNVFDTADMTEDLADNLGRISHASDVDYYKITFDRGGITNFWLGDIPSGCDYQMQIFKGTTLVKTINNNSTGTSEFAQYNTLADTVYYIKISSNSGYNASSYYLFSMRRNNLGEARFFTFNYNYTENGVAKTYNTRPSATNSMSNIWKMGYSGQEYLNNTPTAIYNSLSQCNIVTIHDHGDAGRMFCQTSETNYPYIRAIGAASDPNKTLSTLNTTDVSNLKLLIFMGCSTGVSNTTYGNLVDVAYSKGVDYTIGWNQIIHTSDASKWIGKFYERCLKGDTIYNARRAANEYSINGKTVYIDKNAIIDQYVKYPVANLTIN